MARSAAPTASPPRNRVRGLAQLSASRVEPSAGNWRTHDAAQRATMASLLGEVGSVSELVVWVPDDAERERLRGMPGPDGFAAWLAIFTGSVRLLDGHMRKGLRGKILGVQVTDLDAREAALVLATFDPLAALAGADARLLGELLAEVKPPPGAEDLIAELAAFTSTGEAGDGAGEIETSPLEAEFYLSARGPLPAQPEALERLRAALAALPGVAVHVGLVGGAR